eukprot:Protomagalhaensia_wolfi_Nauph_80__872@NODE_1501_length_1498_cov_871_543523_g1161_i0_p1_GENE_NODE_1501_length_1498_cov_871_543523_g1161_i0NODE_1501_length_1498_cov_871_543523_g1161_i0_p1_ORF_typecomplete_len186_score15_15Glutaredoxin/PF00462_24/2_4e08SH3BGR/PF04908_15/0_00051fn3/PF00041_21/0_13_NODE_1501_length_1498_cov_871_543523_g1161_i0172729
MNRPSRLLCLLGGSRSLPVLLQRSASSLILRSWSRPNYFQPKSIAGYQLSRWQNTETSKPDSQQMDRDYPSPRTRYDAIGLLSELLSNHHVVLFIKGTVEEPRCGHTSRFLKTLLDAGMSKFVAIDVLQSDIVRQTIKELGGSQSIPMLFIKGDFVGGADRVADLHSKGELIKLLTPENKGQANQ